MDVEKSQKWFTELWNNTVMPYLSHINNESALRVCVSLLRVSVSVSESLSDCSEGLCISAPSVSRGKNHCKDHIKCT